MDHEVFNLSEADHVITIASAGCNVLDYIIEGAKVTAVDFNSCQIALTELKKVAILNVEYDVFFEIFSKSNMSLLREVYPTKLRPHLSKPSAEFWDDGVQRIKSFMYSGTSGVMSYFLFRIMFPFFGLGFIREELVRGISKEDLIQKILNHTYAIRTVAWIMDNIALRGGCCFAGVPERQMALGLHRPNNLALVIEKVFFNTDLVKDNYFYSGYFLGYYKPDNCPRYLMKENYAKMRKHLQNDKLVLFHGTMLQAIDQSTVPITVASLLDHMDWMTDRMINEEITHLVRKMDPVRGKIFWRTFADEVHSAPLSWLNPVKVEDSKERPDRVGMYFTTYIAYLKDLSVAYEERVDRHASNNSNNQGIVSKLYTGAKMVTFPLWKPFISSSLDARHTGHAKDIESFYKFQKEGYDAFREGLLHARPALLDSFPLAKDGGMVWIDVGGGTARNLEFFPVEIIRKYFKSIIILDISASLLEIAKKRVELMKLDDIVKVVEHDFTARLPEVLASLKIKEGTVDVVTMSYSFSMIPKQADAIANATKLLKPNGLIAIADFFLKGRYDDCLPNMSRRLRKLESLFHKAWFACDHVHLLADKKLEEFASKNGLKGIWDNRFRGGVPFIPFLQPYHGVYIMKKN